MKDSSGTREQIIHNGFWNIISSVLNRLGGFVLAILLSRILMPEGFGTYSLAMTIALLFITFSDLGINQTLIRFISLNLDKDTKKASAYFKYLFKTKFFLSLLASIILFIGAYYFANYLFHNSKLFLLLIILSCYVLFTSLTSFLECLFFIKKNVKDISLKEFLVIFFKLGAVLSIGFFLNERIKLPLILFSFTILSICSFLFIFSLSRKRYPVLFNKTKIKIKKRELQKFIFFLNIQNISITLLSSMNIIFLGVFAKPEIIGYYNAAYALINGIVGILFSFSYLFLPIFTRIDLDRFKSLLRKTFNLFFSLAIPISFGLCLLSKFFVSIIYEESYFPAATPLGILAFILPCIVGVDMALSSFIARDKQKNFSIGIFILIFVSLILNYLSLNVLSLYADKLILLGIASINLITWSICFIFAICSVKREFNVNIIPSNTLSILFSCLIMSLFLFLIIKTIKLNLISGILLILSSIELYFISLLFTKGIMKSDLQFIKELIKSKRP